MCVLELLVLMRAHVSVCVCSLLLIWRMADACAHWQLDRLNEKVLRDHFHLPLSEVAKKFGMCTTAFKKLCRKQAQPDPKPQTSNPKPQILVNRNSCWT